MEVPAPSCLPGGVVVRNHFSVISPGTETTAARSSREKGLDGLGMKTSEALALASKVAAKLVNQGFSATVRAARNRTPNLNPLGYSCAGIVEAIGGESTAFAVGDRVACAGSGYANHAEFVWVPKNLVVRVPRGVELRDAAYVALGAIALQGIRRAELSIGERALVIGLGLLGQLAVQIAHAAGIRVTGFDPVSVRARLAQSAGAEHTFSDSEKMEKQVSKLTEGRGFDAALIFAATKSNGPVALAMKMCRSRGRVVIVGDVGLDLKREMMYKKELDVVMATSYGPGRYDRVYEEEGNDYPFAHVRWTERRNMQEFLDLVAGGKVDVKALTDLTVELQNSPAAYRALTHGDKKPLGVVLQYNPTTGKPSFSSTVRAAAHVPKAKGNIGFAILGAGGFAQSTHIPNIMTNPNCELRAVLNTSGAKASTLAQKYGAQFAVTDVSELLSLPGIDAVIISTRHNLHAAEVIACLNAEKHILVEKPLAITQRDLFDVAKAAKKSRSIVMVGFNRRYSPLIRAMRHAADESAMPLVLNYRINAGFTSPDHWTQDPLIGGGRIVGELCHFIDTCSFLAASPIKDIQVASIPVDGFTITSLDNVALILRFASGSIASVTYTSIGHESLSKERIEMYQDRAVAVLDDYSSLRWYGCNRPAIIPNGPQKGHREQLEAFVNAIRGKGDGIGTLEEAIDVTQATFRVRELVRGGC